MRRKQSPRYTPKHYCKDYSGGKQVDIECVGCQCIPCEVIVDNARRDRETKLNEPKAIT